MKFYFVFSISGHLCENSNINQRFKRDVSDATDDTASEEDYANSRSTVSGKSQDIDGLPSHTKLAVSKENIEHVTDESNAAGITAVTDQVKARTFDGDLRNITKVPKNTNGASTTVRRMNNGQKNTTNCKTIPTKCNAIHDQLHQMLKNITYSTKVKTWIL